MENKYKAIRNTDSGDVLLVNKSQIIDGYLHDTYCNYGQKLTSYEAGDWGFEQEEFLNDAKEEAENKLGKENINWDNFEINPNDDGNEVIIELYNDDSKDYDMAKKTQKIMNDWAKENYIASEATYLTYWDGHNHRSILFSCDGGNDNMYEYELLDEEDDQKYNDLYERVSLEDKGNGIWGGYIDGYSVTQSCYEDCFEVADITEA